MPAIYPAFEKPMSAASDFNGNRLSRHLPRLDEIASSAKLKPLSRLIDSNTMAHEALDEEQLAAMPVPAVEWHQSENGLLSVRGLLAAIQQNDLHFNSRRGDDTEAVLNELRQLESLLVSAANESNRFHPLVDM